MRACVLLLTLVGAILCLPSVAQKAPADEKAFEEIQSHHDAFLDKLGLNEQELYDLVQSYMLVRIKKALDLTDVQTLNLMKEVGHYKDELTRLKFQKGLLISQLRMRLAQSASESLVQENLSQLFDNDQKIVETLRSMVMGTGDELSVAQRATFYLFVGDFEEDIRRMAQHAQRMNQEGEKHYTKEQHDQYHQMSDDESSAFHALVQEKTRSLDINNPDEKNVIELVDAWLMVRLSSELELTTEETIRLFKRVGIHKDQLQEMKWQISDARLELRIAARDNIDVGVIEDQLEDMLLREEAIVDLVNSFVTEAQKDISTHRAAQLFLFLADFEQEVVDLIQRSISENNQ